MRRTRLAPAKVNLFLHVGPLQPDGYHPVASWMVFADIGDELVLEEAAAWRFEVSGPFAAEIGDGENLVERAAARLFARARTPPPPRRLSLDKQLPVAAGLGGGSSDAGAALILLNEDLADPLADDVLAEIAGELGADGRACLFASPALAQGRGDRLSVAPTTRPLPAVLVNPRRPSATAAVYAAYDARPAAGAEMPTLPSDFGDVRQVAAVLAGLRNDLEGAAAAREPAVGEVLAELRAAPESLLARLSGSGATVFALCSDGAAATALATRLARARPQWWIRACTLSS